MLRLVLLHTAGAGRNQQVPGLPLLLRSFASNSTKEAVERAVIVDTLAQVGCVTTAQLHACVCAGPRTQPLPRQHS